MDFGERAVRSKPIKKVSFGELTFFETTCADEAREPEVHRVDVTRTPNKIKSQRGDLIRGFPEWPLQAIPGDVILHFASEGQPDNGHSMCGHDFLRGLAGLFAAEFDVAICRYSGRCSDSGRIEVAGIAPKPALKGLLRARRGREVPTTLCWRQGHSGDAPLYALNGVSQLVDLLAAAGEVRA